MIFDHFDKKTLMINILILILSICSILTILFPYQIQSFIFDRIRSLLTLRKDYVRIVTNNSQYEKDICTTLVEALKRNSVEVREVRPEKNLLSHQMLLRNKADISIIPGFICLANHEKLSPLAGTIPSHLIMLSPKNYRISEFAQLTNKKVGIKDKNDIGVALFYKLTQIYALDIPPTLVEENIQDIEKNFREGTVECVIWIENVYSPEVQKFIAKQDYDIIEISLTDILTKALPGLHVRTITTNPQEQKPKSIIEIDNVLVVNNRISNKVIRKIINTIKKSEIFSKISYYDTFPSIPSYLTPHPEVEKFLISKKPLSITQLKMIFTSFLFIILFVLSIRYLIDQWRKNKEKKRNDEFEKTILELKKVEGNLNINASYEGQLKQIKIAKSALNWGIQNYNLNKINSYQLIILLHKILQLILPFIEKTIEWNIRKSHIEEVNNKMLRQQNFSEKPIRQQSIQIDSLEDSQLMLFDLSEESINNNLSISKNKKEEKY